jgi:hypothetical protein
VPVGPSFTQKESDGFATAAAYVASAALPDVGKLVELVSPAM